MSNQTDDQINIKSNKSENPVTRTVWILPEKNIWKSIKTIINFAQERQEKKKSQKAPQRAQRFHSQYCKIKISFDSIVSFAADVKQISVRDIFSKIFLNNLQISVNKYIN